MEFQEFWKERGRICEYHKGFCKDMKCPLFDIKSRQYHHNCQINCGDFPEEAEQIVKQWAKEHPLVTNGDKLKEIFGNCMRVDDSAIYPLEYYGRIEKWLKQEYQPPKGEEG